MKGDNDFVRGYICACCCILDAYGADVEVAEALRGIGFQRLDLRIIDVADREILRKWKFIPRRKKK